MHSGASAAIRSSPTPKDGILRIKMTVAEGDQLPDFIAVHTSEGILDSVIQVFTENHKKWCIRYGRLGHFGSSAGGRHVLGIERSVGHHHPTRDTISSTHTPTPSTSGCHKG